MNYWLFKTEPETWSWEMQKKKGAKGEPWSGVRNHTAKQNMKAMKKGDLGFFYHTGDEKAVVGIVEVIGEYRPDPTDETGIFGLVVVKAVKDVPRHVTLAECKANPKLCRHGAGEKRPAFGAAGDTPGMEDRLRHGWRQRLTYK